MDHRLRNNLQITRSAKYQSGKVRNESVIPTPTIRVINGALSPYCMATMAPPIWGPIAASNSVTRVTVPSCAKKPTKNRVKSSGANTSLNPKPNASCQYLPASWSRRNCSPTDTSASGASVSPRRCSSPANHAGYSVEFSKNANTNAISGGNCEILISTCRDEALDEENRLATTIPAVLSTRYVPS